MKYSQCITYRIFFDKTKNIFRGNRAWNLLNDSNESFMGKILSALRNKKAGIKTIRENSQVIIFYESFKVVITILVN